MPETPSSITTKTGTWSRFTIDGLAVAPRLAGACHAFSVSGKRVEVRLPKRPAGKRPNEGIWGDERISCRSYHRDKTGTWRPSSFEIGCVDVEVLLDADARVPAAALSLKSVDVRLFSKTERNQLDGLIATGNEVAAIAIDHWLRTMRWKTLNYRIGQVQFEGIESGWGTYLMDAATRHHFYTGAAHFVVQPTRVVTASQWNTVGRSLAAGTASPLWFDFLFEGEHRIESNDLHGGIVCLAVACESVVRVLMKRHLRRPPNDRVVTMLSMVQMSRLLDQWRDLGFWDAKWEAATDLPTLKKLFDRRNGVMHRGAKELQIAECKRFAKAARAFVAQAATVAGRLAP